MIRLTHGTTTQLTSRGYGHNLFLPRDLPGSLYEPFSTSNYDFCAYFLKTHQSESYASFWVSYISIRMAVVCY